MPETIFEDKVISLRSFESLYDQYADFCRKLRFFINSAFTMEEESLALEIISEFLDQKEKDLHELKTSAQAQMKGGARESESMEILLGRLLMEREDYRILQRITEIRKNGGTRWETLQAIIQEQPVVQAADPPVPGDE